MKQEKVNKFREILSSDLIKEKAKKHGADDKRERKLTLVSRKIQKGYPFWITLTSSKEVELREKVATSYKLKQDDLQHSERSL